MTENKNTTEWKPGNNLMKKQRKKEEDVLRNVCLCPQHIFPSTS